MEIASQEQSGLARAPAGRCPNQVSLCGSSRTFTHQHYDKNPSAAAMYVSNTCDSQDLGFLIASEWGTVPTRCNGHGPFGLLLATVASGRLRIERSSLASYLPSFRHLYYTDFRATPRSAGRHHRSAGARLAAAFRPNHRCSR